MADTKSWVHPESNATFDYNPQTLKYEPSSVGDAIKQKMWNIKPPNPKRWPEKSSGLQKSLAPEVTPTPAPLYKAYK